MKGPFTEFHTLYGFIKDKKFEMIPLFYTGPIAILTTYLGWNNATFLTGLGNLVGESYTNLALLGIVGLLWYMATLLFHFFQMANPDSPHFHIGVYQILRKAEYEAFSPFLHEGRARFSFKSLQHWLYSQGGYKELYMARKEWDQTKQDYELLLNQYEDELRDANAVRNELLKTKNEQLLYLSKILAKTKTNIERLVNNRYGIHDLDFFCPYTLYELQGDKLILIADVGTGANAKSELSIEEHSEYISVQVLTHSEPFKYQRISINRTILSYRMDMPDNQLWVMNLHMNETDEILLEFFFGSAIIEAPELLEVVRAYCRLVKKFVMDSPGPDLTSHQRTSMTGRDIHAG